MDENLKFALTLGAGAVGGAFVAGLFAFIGAWIADKREHKQWLRNERLRAYETYFAETQPWSAARWVTKDIDATKEAQSAKLQLQLVAPKEVLDSSYKLVQQITDFRSIFQTQRLREKSEGRALSVDTELFRHHITVVEQLCAELGHAMRRSLSLSRKEAKQWVSLLQSDPPTEDEYRAAMKAMSN
jgi:hypothetical protein